MASKLIRRALSFFSAFLFMISFFAHCAYSAPVVRVSTEYYDISGQTANELRNEMNSKGILSAGKRHDGHTDCQVRWNYQYTSTKNSCLIDTVSASVDIVYLLPRWVERDSGASELVAKWDGYFSKLQLHEDGHGDIGKREAEEVEMALSKIKKKFSCEEIDLEAKAITEEILARYKEEDDAYDVRTNHGETQGAVFP